MLINPSLFDNKAKQSLKSIFTNRKNKIVLLLRETFHQLSKSTFYSREFGRESFHCGAILRPIQNLLLTLFHSNPVYWRFNALMQKSRSEAKKLLLFLVGHGSNFRDKLSKAGTSQRWTGRLQQNFLTFSYGQICQNRSNITCSYSHKQNTCEVSAQYLYNSSTAQCSKRVTKPLNAMEEKVTQLIRKSFDAIQNDI